MVKFSDLPSEILIKCVEDLEHGLRLSGRITRPDLLSLGLSNRRLLRIVIPVLYRHFTYNGNLDPSGMLLIRYVKALYDRPEFGYHIHVLQLHDWCWAGYARVWRDLHKLTNGEIWTPTMLGSFLLLQASQLKMLDIEYPTDGDMLNRHSETIEKLYIRPTGSLHIDFNRSFPLDGTLKVDFLPHVLRWPRLQKLHMEGSSVLYEHVLLGERTTIPSRTSSLTEIVLRLGEFSPNALLVLLDAPRALTKFTYVPLRSEDVADAWSTGSYADQLPRASEIGFALRHYMHTLRHLSMGRAGSFWSPRFDTFGGLSHFGMLRSMSIDATMMLGWWHCSHLQDAAWSQDNFTPPLEPWDLGSLLPDRLEQVTIGLDKHPAGQDRSQFVMSLTEGIAAEVQAGRLSHLRALHFELNRRSYCIMCEGAELQWKLPNDNLLTCANALAGTNVRRMLTTAGCEITFALPDQRTLFPSAMRYFP